MTTSFRTFVPQPDHPRLQGLDVDIRTYSDRVMLDPGAGSLFAEWDAEINQPFHGVSIDGTPDPTLFEPGDDGAPVDAIVHAARALLEATTDTERNALLLPLCSKAWRQWSNPEIFVWRHGLRLDELSEQTRDTVLDVIKASVSDAGYAKMRDCMFVNGFLGSIVGGPRIMNAFSFNFSLFGTPSLTEPWGWQLTGHHIAMNCLVIGGQMVLTPAFWGAEPNEVDKGPRLGLKVFQEEEIGGLEFLAALPLDLRAQAEIYGSPERTIPPGRRHPADHLHLAGAARDNRVIPYEGVAGRSMDRAARIRLLDLIEIYCRHLPSGPLRAEMRLIEHHIEETWFCWVGGTNEDDPFYYRIQSPVILIEFDHHPGVFLTNETAERFHVHTLVRTPNGNDYGMALIRRHQESRDPG